MLTKSCTVSVKAGPDDGLKEGEFIVYPSTFTREPDSYGDVVKKGAFAETIKEWVESGNSLPGLYGHRLDDPDYFVAGAIEMSEDEHGWRVKGEFDMDSPKGPHVYRLVKSKRISQLSFAYDVIEEGKVDLGDGKSANELRKLKVYEFSFVPIGANQDTSVVAVKAAADLLADGIKAGRVISAKNEGELRAAYDSIGRVLAGLEPQDESKASDSEPEKVEEPEGAKADEPKPGASFNRLLLDLALAESEIL